MKLVTRNIDKPESHTLRVALEGGVYSRARKALDLTPEAIMQETIKANLRGLGGAGFPAGRKWSFVPRNTGKPVYLQLVDQVRYAAAAGALQPGEPLPSIRPLAEELRVNRNTVAKAYAELESQGVIETLPGKGCFLRENHTPFTKAVRQKLLLKEIDEAVVTAHHLQVDEETFLALVRERLAYFEQKAAEGKDGAK